MLNIVFSVTYYLVLHNAISFYYSCIFYIFYNVQTTNLTFVEYVVIAFCNSKQKVMLNSIFGVVLVHVSGKINIKIIMW